MLYALIKSRWLRAKFGRFIAKKSELWYWGDFQQKGARLGEFPYGLFLALKNWGNFKGAICWDSAGYGAFGQTCLQEIYTKSGHGDGAARTLFLCNYKLSRLNLAPFLPKNCQIPTRILIGAFVQFRFHYCIRKFHISLLKRNSLLFFLWKENHLKLLIKNCLMNYFPYVKMSYCM